jgi:predicted nucleic acid-binding protein
MTEVVPYVLDASVAVKWHLHDEEPFAHALTVLSDYREGRIDLLAPAHPRYEVPSASRNAVQRRRLSSEHARTAIDQFLAWDISTVSTDDLIRAGYQQALRFGCSLYDGLYLALAEAARAPLEYADLRLRNSLARRFPLALWIEDYRAA